MLAKTTTREPFTTAELTRATTGTDLHDHTWTERQPAPHDHQARTDPNEITTVTADHSTGTQDPDSPPELTTLWDSDSDDDDTITNGPAWHYPPRIQPDNQDIPNQETPKDDTTRYLPSGPNIMVDPAPIRTTDATTSQFAPNSNPSRTMIPTQVFTTTPALAPLEV